MIELWTVLAPILLADVLNPVLLAATVYSLGTADPVRNAFLLILGHALSYLVAGIVFAIGLEYLLSFLQDPGAVEFTIQLAISALLIYFGVLGLLSKAQAPAREFDKGKPFGAGAAFALGATVNFIGLPFAVPYVLVLDQMLKADLSWPASLGVLLAYNILYATPFAALVLLARAGGRESEEFLARLNLWIDRISAVVLPIILLALGLILAADAIWYFWKDEPLIPI